MSETTPARPADRTAGPPAPAPVPVWATAATVALIPVALLFGAFAGMAADRYPQTVALVVTGWYASWTVTPLLVVASRLRPRRPAWAGLCRWAGWAAPIPPAVTILLVLGL
ncbi:hypothetical protein [Streptomyces sp. CC210A]|uniref:hypothetical protein n=1 Tax=Streptomyces sp. CC210A TaxID=2898184 RepID=UPI001F45CA0F|nr:hypothetical protein [Streptomyces sp. CC210A]